MFYFILFFHFICFIYLSYLFIFLFIFFIYFTFLFLFIYSFIYLPIFITFLVYLINDKPSIDRWMTCNFTSFSIVFQAYQDDGWVIMKGCVRWRLIMVEEISAPSEARNLGPLEQ